jgi:putative ABC transport system permease protein
MGVAAKDSEDFFSDVQTFDLKGGRFFKDGEINTIVLGSMVADGYFDTDPQLKSKININGIDVRVVGILQPVGSQSEDLAIMTSIETIKGLLDNPNEITMIMVKANGDPQTVADEIEKLLDKRHGKGLFSAMTTDQILKRIESVLSIMTFILVGIAAISLLVAAFGIMNTMLMSVLERTREIGVMKAIGATNRQVLLIFLYESIAIGIIGGVIGVLLGAGFTNILIAVFRGFTGMSMTAFINPLLLVFGVIFAVIVSVASGIYPARRAAKLDPIEALRYE